ncbi:MAG: hypothetical protein KJP04_10955, partial [Arenicella sp.]|nr:hypothetical protein [Arenicella sp.]
ANVDRQFYHDTAAVPSREDVLQAYIDYVDRQLTAGYRLNQLARHVVGLYHGEPRSRLWRRYISENAHKPGSGAEVLQSAYRAMLGS